MDNKIILGTRGSALALWQAEHCKAELAKQGVTAELKIIKTKGDAIQHLSFDKIEGKGFFTKELEEALLAGEIDLAVHSMKDMPTNQPEGLILAGVSYRDNPADWLIVSKDAIDENRVLKLKNNAIIGTSSARRKAQLLSIRPDLEMRDIRGNVATRVSKIGSGDCDAVMLAAAGLSRLEMDLSAYVIIPLSPKEFTPAPAQGVMAYQIRQDDVAMKRLIKTIHHPEVSAVTSVERTVLNLLEGGCQMPVGVYCERDQDGNYHVWASQATAWDSPVKRVRLSSSTSANLAQRIVDMLKA